MLIENTLFTSKFMLIWGILPIMVVWFLVEKKERVYKYDIT